MSENWQIKEQEISTSIRNFDDTFVVPKYEILVDNDLSYNILVYNWLVPKSNALYTNYDSSFKNITLTKLMLNINQTIICKGVSYKTDVILPHNISKTFKTSSDISPSSPLEFIEFLRPKECLVLDVRWHPSM